MLERFGEGAEEAVPSAAESSRTKTIASFAPKPVLRQKEQVESQIRAGILSGELSLGDRLPSEAVLAKQFSVSRTTVREALGALAARGLITKVPGANGGSFVQAVHQQALEQVLQYSMRDLLELGNIKMEEVVTVRGALEVPAIRLAARNRNEHDIETLRRIVEMEKNVEIGSPEVAELDVQFHSEVAKASRNAVLAGFIGALHKLTMPVHLLNLSPEVGVASVMQHIAMVAALESGDEDAAEKALTDHLTYLRFHEKKSPSGD